MSDQPSYRILIVEDNPEDRETLSRHLHQENRYDYQILEAELVSEALEICARHQPDLILLDYQLPDDSGLVFLEEWQKRYGNKSLIPVVVLTGQGNEMIAAEAIKRGAQDYWIKGKLSGAEVRQRIQSVLQQLDLKRQITRQQEQQHLVNSIALRIRQSLHLEEVLQRTVEEVRQFLQSDRVLIYKFAPDMSGIIVAEAVLKDYIACLNLQIQDNCFVENYGEPYRQGRIFQASNIQTAPIADCHRNLLEGFQVKANLVVPILLKSRSTQALNGSISPSENQHDLWGLLIAHQCDRPRQWQADEIELLSQLAVQLAIAIQQAEMYERVETELYQRIELELRERRVAAEFRALVENATDIIYRLDPEMRYLYFNPAIEKLIQQPANHLIGKTLQDLGVCPEIISLWRTILDQIIETKTEETIEHPFPDFDSLIWLQTRIVPEFNEVGEVDSFLCIARDISEQQAALQERKRNEETLKFQAQILEQIHDAVISTDINGMIQSWNQPAEKLFGYTSAEVIGQPIGILHKDINFLETDIINPLLSQGILEVEVSLYSKFGELIDISLRLSTVRDEQDNIIRLIGCSNDIRQRKRNEEILKFQAQILERIHDAVICTDVQGKIYSWNQGAEKLYGYTAAEAIGKKITMLYFPEDLPQIYDLIFQPLLLQDSHEVEVCNRTKSGERIYIRLSLSTIRDEQGKIINMIGCSNDISDVYNELRLRKKIEQELQQLNQELEARVEQRTAQLQASQRFIQSITDNTPNIIYIYDVEEQRNIYCNREIGVILGYSPEQIQAMGDAFISNLYHPDELDMIRLHHENLRNLKDHEQHHCEYRMRDVNGQWHWIFCQNTVFLRNEDGQVKQVVGTAQDITERKQSEEQLRNLSDRLSLAMKSGGFGIWEWDIQQDRLIWDDRMYELYGLSKLNISENAYQIWVNGVHPDDREQADIAIQQALRGEQEFNPEFRVLYPDGSVRYIKAYALVQRNENGEPQRMVGLNVDITQAKEAEQKLRNLSGRLSLAIESGGFGIWEWDILQNRLIWDERMYELYGIQKQSDFLENAYETWINGVHPDDRAQMIAISQQALHSEREANGEFRVLRPDGSIRSINSYALVQRNERGEPQRMVGLNVDITQAKEAEQQLRQVNERLTLTNAELDRATRLKDEFLANMSHELRTPLNAILGMTEGLQDCIFGDLTPKQQKAINTIDRSGHHLLSLINDILDLAKVQSGKLELQLAPTAISYLCGNSLTFVKQQAIKKNIQLTTEIPDGLKNIVVDELRIRQVLINLLTNAVKFTPDGGWVKLVVQEIYSDQQHLLEFSVIDNGIGIRPENVSKLFQPFIQIDSNLNRQYSGTGLGLALVRRLVELHQGTVGVTSELGKGSCFTVCLPYLVSPAAMSKTSGSPPQPINSNLVQPPKQEEISTAFQKEPSAFKILLVEDNDLNIVTISSYLGSKGYKIIVAKDGEEGVKLAKSLSPDLILMDIQLPKIDGLEAICQIRTEQLLVSTPIIALTALAMMGDEEKCLKAGANDYISKPVKLKQLVEKIQRLLKI